MRAVPQLSLKSYTHGSLEEKHDFSTKLFSGLKEYGFIVLYDHPIKENLLEQAYQKAQSLFELSDEKKRSYISPVGGFQRGYTPFGTEHAKDQKIADLKEFWHVGRELTSNHKYADLFPENIWPTEIDQFKDVFLKIHSGLEHTCDIILEALTPHLDVPLDYFAKMTKDGNSILRLLHYPPIPENADPQAIRAAAHEDINLITALVAATSSGLQLKDRDGTWLDVEASSNSVIVDAGDMLARITNDVIPATTHRVVNPKGPNLSRYSMPFFMHPHPEAVLSCISSCMDQTSREKYPDILAQDFLMERLRAIGLA